MQDRRLTTTLKNLVLALLNATLILVALCLWFGWQLASTVDGITSDFSQNLIDINPVREEVRGLTSEVSALRTDLAALRARPGDLPSETAEALSARVEALDARLTGVGDRLETLVEDPEALIDYAIDRTATGIKDGIVELRGCVPASDV